MNFKTALYKLKKTILFFSGNGNIALSLEVLKTSSDAVVITDINGIIRWVNNSFVNVTGYSTDQTVGRKIGDLIKSGEHDDQFYKELWDTIISGRIWSGIITNRRKDGSLYFEEQTITPVTGKNNRIVNFIAIKKDITEKIRTEQALQDSEKRWKFALECAGDGLWDWDIKSGGIFYSKQWKSMLGYSEEEIGDSIDEWSTRVHPEDIEACNNDLEKHLGGKTDFYRNEHRVLCRDNTYKWILDRGAVVSWDSEGKPLRVIGTHTDISGRKKTEEALIQKSEEMERFFTVALDLLCIADIDGNFIKVNRAWERTLGYSIDDLAGKNLLDFVHPEDVRSTRQTLSALSDQIPVLNFVNRYLTSEGIYRFIEWRSYPSGSYIYAAARDITDRINYEFELNKLAERLTLATGAAGIGIWDWDMSDRNLIWDEQMYKLYGISGDTSAGLYDSWRRAIHPDDRDYIEALFVEGVKSLSVFHATFRVIWPEGGYHYLEAHALVIRNEKGRAVRITGVCWDVTGSKRMEERLVTLSTTDPLTTAYNRRYFLHVLESEISRAIRYNSGFSLIMFDIDHFKTVNDTYGHDAGDEVLKRIVEMMLKRIRKNDVLARWGGEEFMILLSGTGIDNARIFADKLIRDVRSLKLERSGRITASFGVTEYRNKETSDSVLKRVDELIYTAKNDGRNCVRYA